MLKKINLSEIMIYSLLILLAVVTLFPFLWTAYVSLLKNPVDIAKVPLDLEKYGLNNFQYLFSKMKLKNWYSNSVVVTVSVTLANLMVNTMAGYSLARLDFPGRNIMFMVVLGVMLIPYQVTMIPVYMLLSRVGLINTHLGLIVPFMFNSFGIFLMRQFFITVPDEIEEAAIVDGVSHWGLFWRIMVPLAKTPLLTQAVIIFMWNWNSFIWQSILVNKEAMYTLPVGINTIKSQFFSVPTTVMAGVMVLTIPVVILYLVFQKHFQRGVASTGLKG